MQLAREFNLNEKATFIKTDSIEQNSKGDMFCAPYNDAGRLHLLIFNTETKIDDFSVSDEYAEMDLKIEPLVGLFKPLAVCCFIAPDKDNRKTADPECNDVTSKSERIFCSFYNKATLMHYHFVYDIDRRTAG